MRYHSQALQTYPSWQSMPMFTTCLSVVSRPAKATQFNARTAGKMSSSRLITLSDQKYHDRQWLHKSANGVSSINIQNVTTVEWSNRCRSAFGNCGADIPAAVFCPNWARNQCFPCWPERRTAQHRCVWRPPCWRPRRKCGRCLGRMQGRPDQVRRFCNR